MRRYLFLLVCGVAIFGCGSSPLRPGGKDAAGGAGETGGSGGGTAGIVDAGGAAGSDGDVDATDEAPERDAADASTDGAEVGAFDIAALPGLVLWLDAGKGVTLDPARAGVVKGWADQSPEGNDFVALIVDPAVLLAADAVGGLPAVQLGFLPNMLTSDKERAATFPSGTSDYLIELVARWMTTTPGDDADLFESGIGPNEPDCSLAALDGRVWVGLRDDSGPVLVKSADATFNDGVFRVVGARRAATSLEVRVNGAVDGILIDPTVGANIRAPSVGKLGAGMGLSIAEVVVIVGPTSEADTERLEAHLAEKYGLH